MATLAGDCLARVTLGFHFIGVSTILVATLLVAAWRGLLLTFTLLHFGNPGDHLQIWVCGTITHIRLVAAAEAFVNWKQFVLGYCKFKPFAGLCSAPVNWKYFASSWHFAVYRLLFNRHW